MVKQGVSANRPQIFLRSLSGDVPVSLPGTWRLSTLASFPETATEADASALALVALAAPHGLPPLAECLGPQHRVCILIEDLTRTSPKRFLLQAVLHTLRQIGIPAAHITVLIALGTHRPLSPDELAAAFGRDTVAEYAFVNHDCHAADLVLIGRLGDGTEVRINPLAHGADFRLGIGSIFPHPLNGFGGGGKILFPGIADFHSIFAHHLRHSFRGGSALGALAGNEFHDEVVAMARAGRLDFVINSVLDHRDRLYRVVAGEPVAAHHAGAELCRAITSWPFAEQSDITMISSFPYAEGPQIMKPLAPAGMITRPGGTIILAADCRSPLPEAYFAACEEFRARHGDNLRQAVLDHFAANRPIMANAPPELNMSMAQTILAQHDFRVILVTGDLGARQIERLGFMPAASLAEAMALAGEGLTEPTINIVPAGGVILPVVGQGSPQSDQGAP